MILKITQGVQKKMPFLCLYIIHHQKALLGSVAQTVPWECWDRPAQVMPRPAQSPRADPADCPSSGTMPAGFAFPTPAPLIGGEAIPAACVPGQCCYGHIVPV